HGNAADLCQIVPQNTRVVAIVSSLPLCSLPPPITSSILQQWQYLLHESGIAVQFTYNLHKPAWQHQIQARQIGASTIWANLPPAKVFTFSFHTPKLSTSIHDHTTTKSSCHYP